jgi:hypothetical protein
MANGSIAGMLAQSGQFAGRAIGAPLQAFGQNLGQQIGGMLTQRRQAEEIKQAQQIVSQYTTAGAINPGMLSKKAQEAEAEGKDYLADVFRKGAELANTNLATGQNMAAYNELATRSGLSPEEASIGIRGLIAGQYKDPSSALKGAMDTQKLVGSKAQREYAVEQLRAEGLDEVANDIEKGIYTEAQIGQVLSTSRQSKAAAEQGQAALEAFVTTADLSDTTFGQAVAEGKLKDVPSSLVSKLATEAQQERETNELVKSLRSMDRPGASEAADLLEEGVVTVEGARKLVMEGDKKPKVKLTDMKQYYVEGVGRVRGGKVTEDGSDRMAYQDRQNPNNYIDLPPDAEPIRSVGKVTSTETKNAAYSLADNEKYVALSAADQEKANNLWAAKYLDLLEQGGINREEAEAQAREYTLSKISDIRKEGILFFKTDVAELKETSVPEFDTEEEAIAAKPKVGTFIKINGKLVEVLPD